MSVMIENGVIPVVNENDTVSVTELMFTDNDELSGLIATMMDVDALVILSNVDGIYNLPPGQPGAQVISEVRAGDDLSGNISTVKSGFGLGGMITKCGIAMKVAAEGIDVFIANGERDNVLEALLLRKGNGLKYTHFIPGEKGMSSVKKWLANSAGFSKGEIHIDAKAVEAVMSDKAVSILPVGIVNVVGDFEKDDIITIVGPDGESIGVGKAAYTSQHVAESMGKHGARPVVHYDYLYIE